MKLTRNELEELRSNPLAQLLASRIGIDLNKEVNDEIKRMEEPLKKAEDDIAKMNNTIKDIHSKLDKMVADGKLQREVKDGVTYYHSIKPKQETVIPNKKEEKPNFVMSKEEFVKFVKDYQELISAKNRLEYLFGVNLEDAPSGFSFAGKIQDIIWDFVAIIFGEDNRDDIADFVYGNSNFDTAEQLYDELL